MTDINVNLGNNTVNSGINPENISVNLSSCSNISVNSTTPEIKANIGNNKVAVNFTNLDSSLFLLRSSGITLDVELTTMILHFVNGLLTGYTDLSGLTDFWVDALGNNIIDNSGNNLVFN